MAVARRTSGTYPELTPQDRRRLPLRAGAPSPTPGKAGGSGILRRVRQEAQWRDLLDLFDEFAVAHEQVRDALVMVANCAEPDLVGPRMDHVHDRMLGLFVLFRRLQLRADPDDAIIHTARAMRGAFLAAEEKLKGERLLDEDGRAAVDADLQQAYRHFGQFAAAARRHLGSPT